MGRRKSGPWEKALKEASKELSLPVEHWTVERLATLNLAFRVARSKWASGQAASSSDMVTLMEQLTKLRAEARAEEPIDIKVHFVQRLRGKCCACGAMNEVPEDQIRAVIKVGAEATPAETASTGHDNANAGPSDTPPPPLPPAITTAIAGYREGIGSDFHSQVLRSGEIPPLKRDQPSHYPSPRSISPMSISTPGIDPKPRRDVPGGSAFDDPNPNRKVN